MAKNYKAYEAAEIIAQGINKENAVEYQDITRRFPFFAAMCMKLNEAGLELLKMLPEYITARKINKGCKEALGISDAETVADDIDEPVEAEEVEEEVEEKPAKKSKKKAKKAEPEVEEDEDDLDDEEEEEEVKPKKKAKKVKKAKKEVVEEDDDDDEDFDFD